VWYNKASRPPKCIRKPNKFGRNAKTCWRTFANPFWRSVQTFLVLWHTEAGGTPAFQSFAAFRRRLRISKIFPLLWGRGQASPLQRQRFLVLGDRNSDACWRSSCRLAPTQPPGSRLPTLRLPIRFGVQFKLVWYYYTQRRAGRPRSSPSPPFGGVCEYQNVSRTYIDQRERVLCCNVFFRLYI
jgi:hypothetical protein